MTAAAIATIATVETARTTERVLASLFGLKPATVIFREPSHTALGWPSVRECHPNRDSVSSSRGS
jgi:hypothetical protein